MSQNAITHVVLTDDDGSGTTGTVLNNALFDQVQDAVDTAIGRVVQTPAGSYSVQVTDDVVEAGSGSTQTLYAVSGNSGRGITIINTSASGVVTVDGNGAETIDLATNMTLSPREAVRLETDGVRWWSATNRKPIILRDVTVNSYDTDNTEKTVFTGTVPAFTLGETGSYIRSLYLRMQGSVLNSSGVNRNVQVKAKLGSTTVFDGTATIGSSASRGVVILDLEIAAQNSSTAQVASGRLYVGQGSGVAGVAQSVGGGGVIELVGVHNAVAEDLATALTLSVTSTLSASTAQLGFACNTVQVYVL